ncbi:type I glyceraldehyde-3-phosphate dehydrogenase [Paenibacillus allorhizosphaerae]|uniref:Glyceraldehyde-3-phosphate dehydrogenase 2 n=1 Tax=Paenibacillus allorhizosphaerae TaxID=2849866 RepID=A0ABN7TKJ2_9BACL|nr:type I glyceraldehyde-3-phosphate dehydrogenase [Paenibacillus allorhizosphaerae]CAG7644058.1 Glyceraldehyde-3-phosphate dehydrogenase 2 [Paenibacillus allorhizosphaerae]
MTFAVGISGVGRIGRLLVRKMCSEKQPYQLKAINCIYPVETIAHLLKYDTVHGRWDADISIVDGKLVINGEEIHIISERDPAHIAWHGFDVSLAVDATGKFNNREGAGMHLAAGASHVLITAPGKRMDFTVVMGVNDHLYDPRKHRLLSTASCTTNCLSPVLHILDQAYQVRSGWMTTVHAYTSDQNHLDNPHKDLRRARACTQSIVPTTTGAGTALIDVLPHLTSRIQGVSLRVPTQDVSLVDLTVQVAKPPVSLEQVRSLFKTASEGSMSSYVGYSEEPLVSADFIGCSHSAVVDGQTMMAMGDQIKVLAWYDNEWAYACRVTDFVRTITERVNQLCTTPLLFQ